MEGAKNPVRLGCLSCDSIILQPGIGTFQNTAEFQLPHIHKKFDEEIGADPVTKCWMVPDMFQFENVGFSNTVGNIKYLTCADCERGPIGWHCLDTKLCYVADERVKHHQS